MVRIIDEKSFFYQVELLDSHYWNQNAEARWEYYSLAAQWIKELSPESVLEAGTNGLRIADGSPHCNSIGLCQTEDIVHNLCDVPWPAMESSYDVFVALQVWEHLDKPVEAFQEACKIAKNVILSFPYRWNCPSDTHHHNIGTDEIEQMTGGLVWKKRFRTNMDTPYKRIVYHWEV